MTTKYFNVKNGLTTGGVLISDGNVTLGSVTNVHISGGTNGYLLSTDGSSNLSWVDAASTQSAAPMPIVIDDGNTLTIASNYQGLFGTPITVDGNLVIDGTLVDVSGQGAPGSNAQISFNDQGNPAGNNGFTFNKTNGNLAVPGNINVSGSVLPSADLTYDLGSPTRRFRDAYFSGTTLYIGDAVIESAGGALTFTNPDGGNFVVSGTGNAGTSTISNGNSNVNIATSNGNVTISASGTNTLVITSTGINVAGYSNLGSPANVKISGGTNGYVLSTDGAGNLSWITPGGTSSSIANGESNVSIVNNANINFSIAGYSNRIIFSDTVANFGANLKVDGLLTSGNANLGNTANANYFYGNLVGLADQANIANTAIAVSGANVVGAVANANYSNLSGTVSDNAHPNITSVGTLTSLVVTGNVQSANHFVANNISGNGTAITINAGGTNQNINLRPTGTGIVDAGNFRISNLATPVSAGDAATKEYVDSTAQGLNVHPSANAATTGTLASASGGTTSYDNGTSGVGATITTTGTFTTIDGVNIATVGTRILVKNEANTVWNGIYTYTNSTTLTRATDFDQTSEIAGGDFLFIIAGTVNGDTGWVETSDSPIIGTDPIAFTQFSGAGTYSAGNGLTLTGSVFSVNVAQPGITSLGNLTSLTVDGVSNLNSISNVIITGGSNGQVLTTNGSGNLSWTTLSPNTIFNGTSNVSIPSAGGNVNISVAGTSNVVVVSGTGLTVASGVITGDGSGISNITGANVTSQVANAAYAVSAGSTTVAVAVSGNSQPNITSLGTLTNVIVSGNANLGTLHTDSIKYANGTPYQFTTNAGGANTQVQFNDGNVFGGTANFTFDKTTNTLSVTNISGNGAGLTSITGANVTGTVANATYATSAGSATTAGTVTTASQPNITSVGTLTSVSVTGNGTFGNVYANSGIIGAQNLKGEGGNISNIQGANVSGTVSSATSATSATTAGTVTTAAQPNITSVGTLTGLTVSATITGSVSGSAGTVTTAAQPNITSVGTLTSATVTGNVAAGNLTTTGILSVTGTSTSSIAGNLAMNSKNITGLAEPVNASDAATKNYVDTTAQGLDVHAAAAAATTGTLATASGGTTTYNNGTSGVGATITTTGSYTTIDGVNVATVGTRILVKNEANAAWNGIYTYTSSTVLTRATDMDTTAEIAGGDFVFITSGTTNADTGWVQTTDNPTIGTSNIVWAQFSGAGTYVAGTGLTLTGQTFSVNASQTQVTGLGTVTTGTWNSLVGSSATFAAGLSGANLASITGANVTGTVANATYATSAGSATTAGTVTTAAQPNITSVGTLSGLTVSATITGSVSGSAGTAGTVTTAAQPNITSTGTLTSLTVSGAATLTDIYINRSSGAGTGINWYSSGYTAWTEYMASAGATSCGPTANITAPSGNLVTSWALRSFIENSAGYGWTWESGTTNQTTPTVVAEIRSSDGSFRTAGNVYAVGDVITNYSDEQLKDKQGNIENAIEKISAIETFYYRPNEIAKSLGVSDELNVGVSAQSVNKVAPETVCASPLSDEYLTVKYDRLVPYLIEAIKEQQELIKDLQNQVNQLKGK